MAMVEWRIDNDPVGYEEAVAAMEMRVADIRAGQADELVWLLEHLALYTAGTSAKEADLLDARFPVFKTGRGGEHTYHGPGQRVAYVMLNLRERQKTPDIKKYVWSLEEWVIRTLAVFDVTGERREGRVGIWVVRPEGEKKVSAIGVRIRHWVSYHGVSVNINPDLSHFSGIVPCGISEHGVTSLHDLGKAVSMEEWDRAFRTQWDEIF